MPHAPEPRTWQQALTDNWTRRGALARLLWPISQIYASLLALRRWLYRLGWRAEVSLPVPVIVVGNVVAGGAGKTPVVLALLAHLQACGVRAGVISRGYGRRTTGCLHVTAQSDPQDVGDEPALIARRSNAPVVVAQDRVQAAQALLTVFADTQVLISDDGLQHLRLARALDIVVFDDRGVGNGWLLPAGPLREPWPRQLQPDLVLHSGPMPPGTGFAITRTLADHVRRCDGRTLSWSELIHTTNTPLLALAGIARPERFFAMLRQQGVPLAATRAFADHQDFSRLDPTVFNGYTVLCTEKDAVKLWAHLPQALAVPLRVQLPEDFWHTLHLRLDPLLKPAPGTATP